MIPSHPIVFRGVHTQMLFFRNLRLYHPFQARQVFQDSDLRQPRLPAQIRDGLALVVADLQKEHAAGGQVPGRLRDEPADVSRGVIPDACEMIVRVRDSDLNLNLFTQPDGSGGFRIIYDSASKEFTVDRSQMKTRFNESFGEQRTRVLEESLSELRIFIDRSSVEIFVNDGEAVMTSRVFPQADEHGFTYEGNAAIRIWSLKHAMHEDFVI